MNSSSDRFESNFSFQMDLLNLNLHLAEFADRKEDRFAVEGHMASETALAEIRGLARPT